MNHESRITNLRNRLTTFTESQIDTSDISFFFFSRHQIQRTTDTFHVDFFDRLIDFQAKSVDLWLVNLSSYIESIRLLLRL